MIETRLEHTLLSDKGRGLRIILFMLALLGATFWGIFTNAGPPSSWDTFMQILGAVTLLSLAGGIALTYAARARVSFTVDGNKGLFRIERPGYSFMADVPFRYEVYYTESENRYKFIRVKVPILALMITNAHNETVVLLGHLTALDSPPAGWPHVSQVTVPSDAGYYTEVLMNRINIEHLKTMLDEVHGNVTV